MCTFAEESDYPPIQQLYDVYEQENYPLYLINYKSIMVANTITISCLSDNDDGRNGRRLIKSRR
jgi:hypothetical protein